MKYRLLEPQEWERLAEVLPPALIPTPETAAAAVALDEDGEIQGALFLQLQLHMEPLLIRRSDVSFRHLQRTLEEKVQDRKGLCYFAFTDDERVARMAEIGGMERIPMQIWRKEIE